MVGSSKILTVSYGTFSCTLEGFDDSFDTMKAIAEYFRDLASDDRYFGAEPPTPDAEMLARIAEREVSRRVEARTEGSGIMLRTGEALPPVAQPAPQAAPAAAPAAAPEPAPEPEPEPEPEQAAAPRPEAQAEEAPEPAREPARPQPPQQPVAEAPAPQPAPPGTRQRPPQDPDSVAAKLQRIRAVVGRQASFATEDEEEDIAPAAARPAAGMFDTAPKAEAKQQARPTGDTADSKPAEAAPEPRARPAETAKPADTQEATAPAHPPRARVVRMRKADFDRAVARGEAHRMIETQSGATAPDEAEPTEAEPVRDTARTGAEAESEAGAAASDARDGTDAAILDALSRQEETEAADAASAAPTDAELSEEAERALLAELAALEREMGFEQDGPAQREMSQHDETPAEAEPPRAAQAEPETAQAEEADEVEPEETTEAGAETETHLDWQAEAQPEAEMPAEFEFKPPQQQEAEDSQAPQERRASAAQPSEATGEATEEVTGEAPEETTGAAQQAGQALGTDEADMSRILSATAARMDDPESGRRRESISQMKAAVAATEAARQLGEVAPREATEEAFRDDLRQAVRPRRPVLPTPETEQDGAAQPRAERPRPAPLKLVASQRVDLADEPARSRSVPVRPRRVAVATSEAPAEEPAQPAAAAATEEAAPRRAEAVPAASESFSAFAERMGAQELGDLLEAAAAYTAFVEGAEDFSRPQLMERVREVSPEPISREDGLRSFGTLLRQGMLKRVRSGRFAVAGSSRFNPERRAG
ncbi:hypothetical protein [Limimaricola cinnabarinus]